MFRNHKQSPMIPAPRQRLARLGIVGLCTIALLAACGGSGSDSSSGEKLGTSELDKFSTIADAAQAPVKDFNGPTEPVTPPSSYKVVVVSCIQAAEGCSRPAAGIVEAGKLLGWDVTVVDGKGDVSLEQAGMDSAVTAGADAVVMISFAPATVCPQIKAARAAGIKIVAINAVATPGGDCGPDVAIDPDRKAMGNALAALSIVNAKGDANAVVVQDDEFKAATDSVSGFTAGYKSCKTCEVVASPQILISELTTKVPALLVGTVQKHPKVNVLFNYDAANTYSNPALKNAGLLDRVKVYGYDGNTDQIEAMRKGDVAATAGAPWEWAGWLAVDLLSRAATGDKNWAESPHTLPWKLLTKDNSPEKGGWEGDVDFRSEFKTLWGKG